MWGTDEEHGRVCYQNTCDKAKSDDGPSDDICINPFFFVSSSTATTLRGCTDNASPVSFKVTTHRPVAELSGDVNTPCLPLCFGDDTSKTIITLHLRKRLELTREWG